MIKKIMETKVKLKLPMLPNYLFDDKGNQYSVKDLSDDELKKLGAEWTQALIDRNKKRKLNNL